MTLGETVHAELVTAEEDEDTSRGDDWRRMLLLVVAASLVILVVVGADEIVQGLRLDEWMHAHLLFDYEQEFVRRGLVGEVLRRVSYPNDARALYLLSVAVYLALAVMIGRLAWQALSPLGPGARRVGTLLLLALPFSAPHLGFDVGRSDSFLYLLVLPVVLLSGRVPPIAFAAVGVAGVLIHELFLLVQLPLLVGVLVIVEGERSLLGRRVVLLLGAAALASGLIATAGNLDSLTQEEFREEVRRKVPGYDLHGEDPPHALLFMSGKSALERTTDSLDGAKLLSGGLAAIPGALLAWTYSRLRSGRPTWPPITLVVAPSAGLFLLGADVPRWVSLASFNMMISMLVLLRERPEEIERPAGRLQIPVMLLAVSVAAGPIGVTNAHPLWALLFQRL